MTWTQADVGDMSLRPGLYANFQAETEALVKGGLTGRVAIGGQAAWGPVNLVQVITTEKMMEDYYTKDETSPFDLPYAIHQALLGGAKEVLAFRLVGASSVVCTLTLVDTTGSPVDVIRLDGKYAGARGNSFEITIAANPNNASRKDVTLVESGVILKKWTTRVDDAGTDMVTDLVAQINDDTTNFWLTAVKLADGNDTMADIADVSMASGANGSAPVTATYDAMLDILELEEFSVLAVDTQVTAELAAIETWLATDMRDAGKKVIWVTGSATGDVLSAAQADAQGYNNEGIVYVFPGFKYNNFAGVEVTAQGSKAAARIAGMLAGKDLNESITFASLPRINDVETRLTNQNVKDALASGIMPIVWDGSRLRVERSINTLSTPGTTQSEQFKKVHIIRILDSIQNVLRKAATDQIVGKYLNNTDGHNAVLALFGNFLDGLANRGIIDPSFVVELDDQNPPVADRLFINLTIRPIDAIEYVFMVVEISA